MQALERLRPELGFQLLDVDIDADDELRRRYDTRVPVLGLPGRSRFAITSWRRHVCARISSLAADFQWMSDLLHAYCIINALLLTRAV